MRHPPGVSEHESEPYTSFQRQARPSEGEI